MTERERERERRVNGRERERERERDALDEVSSTPHFFVASCPLWMQHTFFLQKGRKLL